MGSASLHFAAWEDAWRELRLKLAPHCDQRDCARRRKIWRALRRPSRTILWQGARYCLESCLERALTERLALPGGGLPPTAAPHRIPLGLLLLSRRQLTADQLRVALATQRSAGRGRIGEWLQTLGFASEQQITAAVARQWSRPLLRANSFLPSRIASRTSSRGPQIPHTLLEDFGLVPVDYVESTGTLHVAFSQGIDYGVLYAIEQIAGCRTEPCMAAPSFVRQNLQSRSRRREENETVFDHVASAAEFSRIVASYCARLAVSEIGLASIRLASAGPQIWVRLFRPSGSPLDLLLRALGESPTASHPLASVEIPAF